MLLTDGSTVWPKNTLATKTDIATTTNAVSSLENTLSEQQTQAENLETRITSLEATLSDISQDSIWVLEGYISSIGILSGMPEYNGTIEFVAIETSKPEGSTETTVTAYAAFDPAPVYAYQLDLIGATKVSDTFEPLTYTSSFPTKVQNPNNPSDTRAIYSFTTTFDPGKTGFVKLVSVPGSAIGVGDYLPVSGGLSINGQNGLTTTLTDNDGNTLTFKGGILVENTPTSLSNEE